MWKKGINLKEGNHGKCLDNFRNDKDAKLKVRIYSIKRRFTWRKKTNTHWAWSIYLETNKCWQAFLESEHFTHDSPSNAVLNEIHELPFIYFLPCMLWFGFLLFHPQIPFTIWKIPNNVIQKNASAWKTISTVYDIRW